MPYASSLATCSRYCSCLSVSSTRSSSSTAGSAGTLDEAREAVAAERPSLVFLDVHLHGEATDLLLDELRRTGIPVVVVSGSADITQYRDRADQVLGKPFEPSALVAAARRFVG